MAGAPEGTRADGDATAPEPPGRTASAPPPGWEASWAALDGLGTVDREDGEEAIPAPPDPIEEGRAWAALEGRHAHVVSMARMDVATFLEEDRPFPVAFRDFDALASWARTGGLDEPRAIGSISPSDAVQVVGEYRVEGAGLRLPYNQVWVRAEFADYRQALLGAATRGGLPASDFEGLDADHVLNRARLASRPEAWVLLFPVHRKANRPFGAVEARLPPVDFVQGRIDLDPLTGLKLFCSVLPGRGEVDLTMGDVEGQIASVGPRTKAFLEDMRRQGRESLSGHRHKGRGRWRATEGRDVAAEPDRSFRGRETWLDAGARSGHAGDRRRATDPVPPGGASRISGSSVPRHKRMARARFLRMHARAGDHP